MIRGAVAASRALPLSRPSPLRLAAGRASNRRRERWRHGEGGGKGREFRRARVRSIAQPGARSAMTLNSQGAKPAPRSRARPEADDRYETLFRSMSEGFALCEIIGPLEGPLTDYRILEINPALQAMLGVGPDVAGRRLTEGGPADPRWLAVCDRVLRGGEPASFEFHNRATGRWHEIRVSRVAPGRMAQFFFDITERKLAEARQLALFDELNHRVKNNLTVISALLTMHARVAEPAVEAELSKAVARLRSIAGVHEALHPGRGAGEVDFAAYLVKLCRDLRDSLIDDGGLELVVEAAPARMDLERAVPLGIVVNELVTNAIKHAYAPGEGGRIDVRFARKAAGAVLTIADRGRGLPPDFASRPTGLGLRILQPMIRQVGGSLAIRAEPGAAFEITLPDLRAAGGLTA